MKQVIRNLLFAAAMGMLLAGMGAAVSDAKTIRITPAVQKGKTKTIYTVKKKKGKTTLKKLTAKVNDKSIASVKVAKISGGKKYCVKVTGKMTGSVDVKVKVQKKLASGKVKTSTLWFSTDVWTNEKQKAQEAFELQNTIRKKEGKKELEWSEELYQIAMERAEKDGFDGHEGFFKRLNEHFGLEGETLEFGFSENLCKGTPYAMRAVEAWKKSVRHHFNMVSSDWLCGAIAYSEETSTWVAIFSRKPLSVIEGWRTNGVILRVKRTDSATGEGVLGSEITIFDENGKEIWRTGFLNNAEGSDYMLIEFDGFIIGKTYKVIETSAPEGYKKATSVTFVARSASEGVIEIVLSSDKK